MRPAILTPFFTSLSLLKGIGSKTLAPLKRLGGGRFVDLLFHLPIRINKRKILKELPLNPYLLPPEERSILIKVYITSHIPSSFKKPYQICALDEKGQSLELIYFNVRGDYLLKVLPLHKTCWVAGTLEWNKGKWRVVHPDFIKSEEAFIEHENEMIEPIYGLTAGITQNQISFLIKQVLSKIPDLEEWLDPPLLRLKKWPSFKPALTQFHLPTTKEVLDPLSSAYQRLAYDELLAHQLTLALTRTYYKKQKGHAWSGGNTLLEKALKLLPFSLTPSQKNVLEEIFKDISSPQKMRRLLQGDVGSGKTLVAFLAGLKVIEAGGQAALLVPTEILAHQHYKTLFPLLKELEVPVGLLTGQLKAKEKQEIYEKCATGELLFLIGTHALIQEAVEFKNLALVIIDEQHRFGVNQRLQLSQKGEKADLLVMTATPIPRTLALTLYGDLDLSIMREKPPGRQPIQTKVLPISRLNEVIESLKRVFAKGEKVYWVCPLIEESEKIDLAAASERALFLEKFFKGKVGLLHGKMSAEEKAKTMEAFLEGTLSILVATTVIEVGVHVPEATVMIVEHAERFGLSQLHQLRGRVGRGENASTCLLLYENLISETARARLGVLRESEDGFKIAEADLEIRGGGEALGTKQSGGVQFKIANLQFHHDLLKMAYDEARLVLLKDPSLKTRRGQNLRMLLYLFEKERAIQYIHSG